MILTVFANFMKSCNHNYMIAREDETEPDEFLQIQVPAITKRALGHRAVDAREPIRMIVLRALDAYGIRVPPDAIADRRRRSRR